MPHYFFHLDECGDYTQDEEGRDLPDTSAALIAARQEARTIMAAEVLGGKLCLSCRIDIVEHGSETVVTVPFKDALTVTGM